VPINTTATLGLKLIVVGVQVEAIVAKLVERGGGMHEVRTSLFLFFSLSLSLPLCLSFSACGLQTRSTCTGDLKEVERGENFKETAETVLEIVPEQFQLALVLVFGF
jgi:hypothetical protein